MDAMGFLLQTHKQACQLWLMTSQLLLLLQMVASMCFVPYATKKLLLNIYIKIDVTGECTDLTAIASAVAKWHTQECP